MKRLLLPLLSLLIPAAHATNYVECEAIRNVIVRTQIQEEDAFDEIKNSFQKKKVNQKYNVETCDLLSDKEIGKSFLDPSEFANNFYANSQIKVNECVEYRDDSIETFKKEWNEYYISSIKIYRDIETRATKDFKRRGCYWL